MDRKFKINDKVKISRNSDNYSGFKHLDKEDCYIQEVLLATTSYTVRTVKNHQYVGLFKDEELELIPEAPKFNYEFKVGDKLKIVHKGSGVGEGLGKIITVTELGEYFGGPGYRFEDDTIDSNCKSKKYNGFCGERSFELYEEDDIVIPESKFKVGDKVQSTGKGWQYTKNGINIISAIGYLSAPVDIKEERIIEKLYSKVNKTWFYTLEVRGNMVTEDALQLVETPYKALPEPTGLVLVRLRVVKSYSKNLPKGAITWTRLDNWEGACVGENSVHPEHNRHVINFPVECFEEIKKKYDIEQLKKEALRKYSVGTRFLDLVHNKEFVVNGDRIDTFGKDDQLYIPVETNALGNKTARVCKIENGEVIWAKIVNETDFKYQIGDCVITQGYNVKYDGRVLKIKGVVETSHDIFCYFDVLDGGEYISGDNFGIEYIYRKATEFDVLQAKQRALSQYDYTSHKISVDPALYNSLSTTSGIVDAGIHKLNSTLYNKSPCAEIPLTPSQCYSKEQAFDEPVLIKQVKKSKRIIAV